MPKSTLFTQKYNVADTVLPSVGQQSLAKAAITQNSLVYLVSDPKERGFVIAITDLGETTKYNVFIDNAIHTFYTGQIAPVIEASGYQWIDVNRFRNLITAYKSVVEPETRYLVLTSPAVPGSPAL